MLGLFANRLPPITTTRWVVMDTITGHYLTAGEPCWSLRRAAALEFICPSVARDRIRAAADALPPLEQLALVPVMMASRSVSPARWYR
jgi:hypothetical protein